MLPAGNVGIGCWFKSGLQEQLSIMRVWMWGTALMLCAACNLATAQSLATSLDYPGSWDTYGATTWMGQTNVTHDGVDAAATGDLFFDFESFQHAYLDVPTSTSGLLSFWWKVSSLTNEDVLIFQVGNSERARISGEVDWQQRSCYVPKGALIRWSYNRPFSVPSGQNRAWLDEVMFVPVYEPVIFAQPRNLSVPSNQAANFSVEFAGDEPASLQWYFNSTNVLADETNATLSFASAQLAHVGGYSVVISNSFGVATSMVAALEVYELAQALETTNLTWVTSGNAYWFNQTNATHDWVDALASGPISEIDTNSDGYEYLADGHYAALKASVIGPGMVTFWWKVSSEQGFDPLQFSIRDLLTDVESPQAEISGEVDWQNRSFFVPEGEQELSWIYRKDSTVSTGQDRGWLDEVVFARQIVPVQIVPVITNQPQSAVAGLMDVRSFAVGAFASETIAYQWFFNGVTPLVDETNAELQVAVLSAQEAGDYSVVLSTSYGSVTSSVASLHLLTLAEALDNMLMWTNTGSTNLDLLSVWMPQTTLADDGEDAVQIGPLYGEATSELETVVNGPGFLSFWWAAFSPAEEIRFSIGANIIAQSTATDGWEYRVFAIPPGPQTLRWAYSNMQDTVAWSVYGVMLDEVTFHDSNPLPYFTLQPENRDARANLDDVSFTANGTGYPTPARQWLFNGVPLLEETNSQLYLSAGLSARDGIYQMVLSNNSGSATSEVARLVLHKQHMEAAQRLGCVETGHAEVDVQVVGLRAYVADFNFGLRIFDITNPTNAILIGSHHTTGYARGIAVSNGIAYVATSGTGVEILDVSSPANIALLGSRVAKGDAVAVALAGSRLYVANGSGGLVIYDVGNPTNVSRLGYFRPPGSVERVRVKGNVAYLASSGFGLYAVDVSVPSHPTVLDFFPQPGAADLQVAGDVVYLVSRENQTTILNTVDVSDPAHFTSLDRWSHYSPGGQLPRVQVSHGVVFLSVSDPSVESEGFQILDAFDPRHLVWTSEFGTDSYPNAFQIVGDYLYIANGGHGFCVYQLNEFPTEPPAFSHVASGVGMFRATVTQVPDFSPIIVECSTNLHDWQAVQTNTFIGPALEVSFPQGNNSEVKFFRVRTN